MKMLSSEVKNLLDKLYNLRGNDSVILVKMNKEREEAIVTQERTKKEKEVLLEKISNLKNDEQTLAAEGEKLTKLLNSINRRDYATVLDRLNINFDPDEINSKVSSLLPETISKVVEENKKASKELEEVEIEMNNAITKAEELGIRKEEALSNQAKLNEYFNLALDGNINITRDAITSLLEKFDFNEDEQREAAKILMFPEDALYEYDAGFKSKTLSKHVIEDPRSIESDFYQEDLNQKASTEELVNKKEISEIKESVESKPTLENIFEQVVSEHTDEEIKLETPTLTTENIIDSITNLGINSNMFNESDLNKLSEHYDATTFKNNIAALNTNKIELDVLKNNPELLYDKELDSKLSKLLSIGKSAHDIYLTPKVLVKYDLQGLNNTIDILKTSGLDPKVVPLMAY